MSNTNAENGKSYERRIIDFINSAHPRLNAFRPSQPSWQDRGDIRFSTVVLQAKTSNTGTATFGRYVDDARAQAATYTYDPWPLIPAVVVRRGDHAHRDLVVLPLNDFVQLVAERDAMEAQLYPSD